MYNSYYPYNNYYPYNYGNQNNGYSYPQKSDIVQVNGENGARAYQLPPNSRVLLLDEKEPIIWLVQSDGAGYKTINAYDINPHEIKEQSNIDISNIEVRLSRLESMINEPNIAKHTREQNQLNASDDTKC